MSGTPQRPISPDPIKKSSSGQTSEPGDPTRGHTKTASEPPNIRLGTFVWVLDAAGNRLNAKPELVEDVRRDKHGHVWASVAGKSYPDHRLEVMQ